jgi:hypothetical protein
VRIGTDEQRTVDVFRRAVFADGLRGGEDVPLVETALERTAAMPRGSERHALRRHRRIGCQVDIGREQFLHVDQCAGRRRFACERIDFLAHAFILVFTPRVRLPIDTFLHH